MCLWYMESMTIKKLTKILMALSELAPCQTSRSSLLHLLIFSPSPAAGTATAGPPVTLLSLLPAGSGPVHPKLPRLLPTSSPRSQRPARAPSGSRPPSTEARRGAHLGGSRLLAFPSAPLLCCRQVETRQESDRLSWYGALT